MDTLYAYTDYRTYLKDYFSLKKQESAGFSLRVLADRAGFKARDYLLRVMNGGRNLSQSGALMLSRAMRLSEKETEYFTNLVGFNQAANGPEKEHYFRKLSEVCPHGRYQKVRDEEYEYFAEWYHSAVRSLLPVAEFGEDYVRLARTLNPPISPGQARKSVDLLLKLGFVKRDSKGRYVVSNPSVTTGDEVRSLAVAQFHKKALQLAAQAIDQTAPAERDVSGVTMSLSQRGFERIKEEVQAFRKRVMAIAEADQEEDRAYQMCVQLFPISKRTTST